MRLENVIKIFLAIMLFACLLDMPYGYYQFVRLAGLFGFGFLAYEAKQQAREIEMFVYVALALLFQPFYKISLGREIWNIVDVVIGMGLLISLIFKNKLSNE